MANKKQLRVIARNIIATQVELQEICTGKLSEKDLEKLDIEYKKIACSIVRKCYRSKKFNTDDIIQDVLINVR